MALHAVQSGYAVQRNEPSNYNMDHEYVDAGNEWTDEFWRNTMTDIFRGRDNYQEEKIRVLKAALQNMVDLYDDLGIEDCESGQDKEHEQVRQARVILEMVEL